MSKKWKTFFAVDKSQVRHIARSLAKILRPGDTIALYGELGSGKSTLCREIIRSITQVDMPVPSPTFTLVETYTTDRGEIWHMDWYRIQRSKEVLDLGLEEALQNGICLIEWAIKARKFIPEKALHIHMEQAIDAQIAPQHTKRNLSFGGDLWKERLKHVMV